MGCWKLLKVQIMWCGSGGLANLPAADGSQPVAGTWSIIKEHIITSGRWQTLLKPMSSSYKVNKEGRYLMILVMAVILDI